MIFKNLLGIFIYSAHSSYPMKKAVITGATGGLGHEIAKKLLEKGIKVVNLSRNKSSLDITHIEVDLRNNKKITDATDIIKRDHQDTDLLILCSGVLHRNLVGEINKDDIDNDFGVNIASQIKIVNELLPIIKKNKGDIVIVGSTSSFVANLDEVLYASTKHAVLGFIKSLQVQLKNDPVRVIGFYPGGFKSEFHIKAKSPLNQD